MRTILAKLEEDSTFFNRVQLKLPEVMDEFIRSSLCAAQFVFCCPDQYSV